MAPLFSLLFAAKKQQTRGARPRDLSF